MTDQIQSLFVTPGTLSLNVGAGFLTAFEVAHLKQGDIVKSSTIAGEAAVAYFNGHFLLTAEVVILAHTYGFRVVGFTPPPSPDPGRSRSVAEILPFVLRLGSISVRLEELQGVGVGSVVSLDKPFSTEEDAELVVAGIPVAAGKVDAVYENVGLRLTRVCSGDGEAQGEPLSSGNLLPADVDTDYAKDYNFKRPDKFSKYAIDRVVGVHKLLAQNLGIRLEGMRRAEVVADQATLKEALDTLADTPARYLLARNTTPGPRPETGGAEVRYVEPRNAEYPAPEEVRTFIDRVAREEAEAVPRDAAIIAVSADAEMDYLVNQWEFLFSALRGAWRSVADMHLVFERVASDAADAQVVHPNEMVLIMALRDPKSPQGWLMVIYPYLTLVPYHGLLG